MDYQTKNTSGILQKILSLTVVFFVIFSPITYIASADVISDSQCTSGNNLLVNPGFETPVISNNEGWDVFASPVSGWHVEWVDASSMDGKPALANLEFQKGGFYTVHGGNQFAELDTNWNGPSGPISLIHPASVRIYQDVSTVAGATYKVKFFFSAKPGFDATQNKVSLRWNGSLVETVSLDGSNKTNTDWKSYEYALVATGTTTRIEFSDAGIPDSFGTFLDDTSVVCASLPNNNSGGSGGSSSGTGGGGSVGEYLVPPVTASTISPQPTTVYEPSDENPTAISIRKIVKNPSLGSVNEEPIPSPESNPNPGNRNLTASLGWLSLGCSNVYWIIVLVIFALFMIYALFKKKVFLALIIGVMIIILNYFSWGCDNKSLLLLLVIAAILAFYPYKKDSK